MNKYSKKKEGRKGRVEGCVRRGQLSVLLQESETDAEKTNACILRNFEDLDLR